MGMFTKSELEIAKSVDLKSVASYLGYTVKRIGSLYTIKEMDSIRIYPDNHWYRWSGKSNTGITGGSQIDFVMEFCGMDIKDAVSFLLNLSGAARDAATVRNAAYNIPSLKKSEREKRFILPAASSNNMRITEYLTKERGLSVDTVNYFLEHGLIYESQKHHNVVFLGLNASGVVKFASMRGIYDRGGRTFKCDVAGNDKRYAFHVEAENSDTIVVLEAAIDLMSYFEIHGRPDVHILALGMTADKPLEQYLKDHPGIRNIRLCLDNDQPGREASHIIAKKYLRHGYRVDISGAPKEFKDYNEWLVKMTGDKTRTQTKQR